MATIGLDNYIMQNYEDTSGEETHDAPVQLAKAITAAVVELAEAIFMPMTVHRKL